MEIRVLGPVDLVEDGTAIPISSTIQRTLLALLIVGRGEVVSADHLVDAVWRDGERPERRRLWFHVSKLRDLLGATIGIQNLDGGYRLSLPSGAVDAWRFEEMVASGLSAEPDDPEAALRTLRSALALWRGEAYANVPADALGWAEKVRLDELRSTALEHSVEIRLRLGEYDDAIAELEPLIAAHPYRERLRGQLMRALYATGRQSDALRAYAATRRVLVEELGIEPSPALQDLELQILRQDPDLATTPLIGPPSDRDGSDDGQPDETDRFVGRRGPLAEIDLVVDGFLAGGRQAILIEGQAGAGKSALAGAALARVQGRDAGALIAEGRGRIGSGQDDPFGAVRGLPRLMVGDLASVGGGGQLGGAENIARLRRCDHILADALAERGAGLIGTLLSRSEVRRRLSGTTAEIEAESSIGDVADELVGLLIAVARRVPLVVVVDDLHWADAASIDLLVRLLDEGDGRLLLLGTYRPEEIESRPGHPLGPALDTIRRLGGRTIDLDEEGPVEARGLIDELLDREPNSLDAPFREELTRITHGNPLFALEFIADLKERGVLRRDDEGWHLASEPDWRRLPARVDGVLSARFGHAGEDLLRLLRTASVEGETFTAEVIGIVHGLSEADVVEALSRDAADRHRLVAAVGPARMGGRRVFRYRFRHHLLQAYLYERLDEVERSLLHGTVADALVRVIGDGRADEHAVTLARHYEDSGLPEKAVGWLARAARHAIRLSANDAAVELLLQALRLSRDIPDSASREAREFELWLQLGTASSITAGFGSTEVRDAFTRASELVGAAQTRLQQLQVYFGLFVYYASVGDFDDAIAYEERAFSVADASGDPGMRVQALHSAWPLEVFRGEVEPAIAHCSEALELYRHDVHHPLTFSFGNHDAAVCALALGGLARAIRGEGGGAVTSVRQAIDLARTLDHAPSTMQASTLSCWVHQLHGDVGRAAESAESVLRLGPDAPVWTNVARSVLAWVASRDGSAGAGIAALAEEFELTHRVSPGWIQVTGSMLMDAFVSAGRTREALTLAPRLFRNVEEVGGFYVAEVFRTAGLAHAADGAEKRAVEYLQRAVAVAQGQSAHLFAVRASVDLARVGGDPRSTVAIVGDLPPEFDRRLLPADV